MGSASLKEPQAHLQRKGPFAGTSCCQRGRHLQEDRVSRSQAKAHSHSRPRAPRTGSQVPLVEVLQLDSTLPLTLLSWRLLHAGGHRVGPTWGQTGSPGAQPQPRAESVPTGPGAPTSTQARDPSPPPPVPRGHTLCITFPEGLRIRGVEGVQALPGVWGVLSTEHKQTQESGGRAPSPSRDTRGGGCPGAAAGRPSTGGRKSAQETHCRGRDPPCRAPGLPTPHLQPGCGLRGLLPLPECTPPGLGSTLQRNTRDFPLLLHPGFQHPQQLCSGARHREPCRNPLGAES